MIDILSAVDFKALLIACSFLCAALVCGDAALLFLIVRRAKSNKEIMKKNVYIRGNDSLSDECAMYADEYNQENISAESDYAEPDSADQTGGEDNGISGARADVRSEETDDETKD